jgi:hypothetical protein
MKPYSKPWKLSPKNADNGGSMLKICIPICQAELGVHMADQIETVSQCSKLNFVSIDLGLNVDQITN